MNTDVRNTRGAVDTAPTLASKKKSLFASAVGQPPEAPLELPNGYGFVVVDRVIPAEGEPGDALEGEITSEMATDLADQYDQALRQRFPPVVHERALATFLRADGQPQ